MDISHILNTVALYALPLVFGITVHEAAHAYAAKWRGDLTAYKLGRTTLNPAAHVDPVGTIAVPLATLLLSAAAGGGGALFGWAKPVPVEARRMRYPRKDMFWVALAGPASNFLMALGWALVGLLANTGLLGASVGSFLAQMGNVGIQVNLVLMLLNLFPIPPLDGSQMLARFLKGKARESYEGLARYGFFILLALMFSGILWKLYLEPAMRLFSWIYAIPALGALF